MSEKPRKVLRWVLALTLLAGLVYAGLELAGQSNKAAVDAGSSAADMEMASLDTIKKPAKAPSDLNWTEEGKLRKKIDVIELEYRELLKNAQNDIAIKGEVAVSTRDSGLASAQKFQSANEKYAEFWDKGKHYQSRAKLARETGDSRLKSAAMAFNKVDSEKIDAYSKQQESLQAAQKGYFVDAKTDLSTADRESIKAGMTPRLNKMTTEIATLTQQVAGLLGQVKDQLGSGMSINSIGGGCAKSAARGPSDSVSSLLSPLTSLLSLVKGMGSNIQNMLSDISTL